jgi:hypothetical protein
VQCSETRLVGQGRADSTATLQIHDMRVVARLGRSVSESSALTLNTCWLITAVREQLVLVVSVLTTKGPRHANEVSYLVVLAAFGRLRMRRHDSGDGC